MSQEIKVMSCNLRYRTEKDGANCFDYRFPKLLAMIRKEAPDVIGFQEATDEMRKALTDGLTDYVLLGHGREKNYMGEGTPIAYRKSALSCTRCARSGCRSPRRCPRRS